MSDAISSSALLSVDRNRGYFANENPFLLRDDFSIYYLASDLFWEDSVFGSNSLSMLVDIDIDNNNRHSWVVSIMYRSAHSGIDVCGQWRTDCAELQPLSWIR